MKIKALCKWTKEEREAEIDSLKDIGVSIPDDCYSYDYLYFDTDDIGQMNMSEAEDCIVVRFRDGGSFLLKYSPKLFELLTKDYKEIK